MDKIVDMKFTIHNSDGSIDQEKVSALTNFAQSWAKMRNLGASEDELEVLLRMAEAQHQGVKPQIRGELQKSDLSRAAVEALALGISQFAHLGMSEQDVKLTAELAIARVFGRTS